MAAHVEEQANTHAEPEQPECLLGEQQPLQQEQPEPMVQKEDEVDMAPEADVTPEVELNAEPMDIATQAFTSVETATQAAVAPALDRMDTATQVFTAVDATQAYVAPERLLDAGSTDLATQVFTAAQTATQELLDTGSVDMATQAFTATQADVAPEQMPSAASMDIATETATQVEAASIEYSTQVVPEGALRVFSPTQVATAPSAKEREDAAEGAVVAVPKKKASLSKKKSKGKGAAAKARARTLRTVEQLKRRAGPKKPKGSYSIWLGENRKKVRAKLVADGAADPSFEDIARAAGKTWSALTKEEKAPFVERAKVLSAKYKDINKACKEYKKANSKDLRAKAKVQAKKAAKAKQVAQKKKEASSKKAQKQDPVDGSAKKVATPQKRTTSEGATKQTPSKAKKGAPEKTVYLDMGLLAEAEQAGLGGTFRRLAEREDMKQYSQRVLLDALVANEGLLHRAKDCVLAGKA